MGKMGCGLLFLAMEFFMIPLLGYAEREETGSTWLSAGGIPGILLFMDESKQISLESESRWTKEEIIKAEGQDEFGTAGKNVNQEPPETSAGKFRVKEDLAQLLLEENANVLPKLEKEPEEIRPDITEEPVEEIKEQENKVVLEKKQIYQWEYYQSYDELVREFYTVDASTAADGKLLNLNHLLEADISIEKRTDEAPQILIYHTHSQEGFADSVPGDPSTTIMGVGQVLARILEDSYGYNVMHHLGQYDVENRDYAYNTALPYLEQLLAEYPTIEVVIDLHRDEMAEETRLVTEIDGRPTARFMFFNGLSRTRKHGEIEYLPNENLSWNLAFSFQMQTLCNQYYPGLTRRIYLKGYRYNMHLKERYLLVEMGAQNNTYQECYNACIPLAKMLDLALSGTETP